MKESLETFSIPMTLIHKFRNTHSIYKDTLGKQKVEVARLKEKQENMKKDKQILKNLESKKSKLY